MPYGKLTDFERAYCEAALWSTLDENDVPLDQRFAIIDLPTDFCADCDAFLDSHREFIGEDVESVKRAGHDLWLTRNGHGAGFWDGDWPEPGATVMSETCEALGSVELYVGDDGKLCIY